MVNILGGLAQDKKKSIRFRKNQLYRIVCLILSITQVIQKFTNRQPPY